MIWLKNIIAYRLDAAALSAAAINAALAAKPFIAPSANDLFSQGWVAPAIHASDLFTAESQGALLVTLRTDEKILPASVVRQQADERAKKIEAEENRRMGRRELRELRERMADELLPRALVKTRIQRAIIDLREGFVYVEGSGASKSENLLSLLRETLGSLPTRLIDTKVSPQTAMTMWLSDGAPRGFALDADCELRFPGDNGAIAKLGRQQLESDEVRNHLAAGKLATQLGLVWNDRLAFVLTEKLTIKRLTMLDVVQEELEAMDATDQAALFESSLALLLGELRQFLPFLFEALGGEVHSRESTA